ncbi:hypothetical protein ENBRE01_1643, partial [Enteropsectra breve]
MRRRDEEEHESAGRAPYKNNNKPFYSNRFSGRGPQAGYGTLDPAVAGRRTFENKESRRTNELLEQMAQLMIEKKREEYTFTAIGDCAGVKLNITRLEDLEAQDVLKWTLKVEEVFALAGIKPENETRMLAQMVDIKIWDKVTPYKKDLRGYLDGIISIRYNRKYFNKLERELEELSVGKYESIAAYYAEFQKLTIAMDRCVTRAEALTLREKSKYFVKGLAPWMKEEMARQDHDIPVADLVEKLGELERVRREIYLSKKITKFPKTMYCSIHRSRSHNTKDCIAARDEKQDSKTRSDSLANIIVEREDRYEVPTIPIKIGENTVIALIDSGAQNTFVTQHVCKDKGIEITEKTSPTELILADGTKIKVLKEAKLRWNVPNIPHVTFKATALVLKDSAYDIILGGETLRQMNTEIDYKKQEIRIDRIVVSKMQVKEFGNPLPDQMLMEYSCSVTPETVEGQVAKNDLESVIKEAREKNPEIGCVQGTEHSIQLEQDVALASRAYKVPEACEETLREEIEQLLTDGIIRRSNSFYASPAFMIKKASGGMRLVIDYRKLNEFTKKEKYPFPSIDEMFRGLYGRRVFSTIDLNRGYYQVPVEEQSRKYTAFTVPGGHFEFCRMPFGLVNAPRTFQKAVEATLRGTENFARVYIDDILIASHNEEEHVKEVETVIKRLHNRGFSINFKKSIFGTSEAKFLGRIINAEGIQADIGNKLNISQEEWPATKKKLQGLIGLINWFRNFVPNISTKLAKITEKLQTKDKRVTWTEDEKEIVKGIINTINERIVIHHLNPKEKVVLETDASDCGLSAILRQETNVVGIYSCKLNKSELNYTTMEKELLAIIKGLCHFRNMALGRKIEILTDNKNLTFDFENSTQRAQRWKGVLNEFDVLLTYRPGKENTAADFLSRVPQIAMSIVEQKEKITDELEELHDKLLHPGGKRMYMTLKNKFKIKNLKGKCEEIAKNCKKCQVEKNYNQEFKSGGALHSTKRNKDLCADILGPIELSNFREGSGRRYVLVIMDRHSRLCLLQSCRTITTTDTIRGVNTWIRRHGKPETILTDQGRQFIGSEFQECLRKNEILHKTSTAYNPTGNSIVERLNQEISKMLRVQRGETFQMAIMRTEEAINSLYNRSIKQIPYEVAKQKDKWTGEDKEI